MSVSVLKVIVVRYPYNSGRASHCTEKEPSGLGGEDTPIYFLSDPPQLLLLKRSLSSRWWTEQLGAL